MNFELDSLGAGGQLMRLGKAVSCFRQTTVC